MADDKKIIFSMYRVNKSYPPHKQVIKDISLSYDVPRKLISRFGLTRLQPYVSATNLLTLTDYSGMDPEVNQYGNSGSVQGIDWGTYPLNKSVVLGIKVEF